MLLNQLMEEIIRTTEIRLDLSIKEIQYQTGYKYMQKRSKSKRKLC